MRFTAGPLQFHPVRVRSEKAKQVLERRKETNLVLFGHFAITREGVLASHQHT